MALGTYNSGDEVFDWSTLDGQKVTSAHLNLHIQQVLIALMASLTTYTTYLVQTSTNAINNSLNNTAPLTFQTLQRNSLGGVTGSGPWTGITVPNTGYYLVIGSIAAAVPGTVSGNFYYSRVMKNGVLQNVRGTKPYVSGSGCNVTQAVHQLFCTTGDVIALTAYSSIGNSFASDVAETSLAVTSLGT